MRSLLKNKHNKEYSYLSRYRAFPVYYHVQDKKYTSGITAYLDDNTPYTLHVVKRKETFDSIANDYYGNPTLYWIICSFNRIQNPYKELKEGESLKIPSISNLRYDTQGRS